MSRSGYRNAGNENTSLELARVLLVHGELAPRLTLQTILRAGGYSVDAAATPAEALTKLDEGEYDLVLSEAEIGDRSSRGRNVLAYARVKQYQPATAVITSCVPVPNRASARTAGEISIHTENLAGLLGKVAELIGMRAIRRGGRVRQAVRQVPLIH